jgi:hypothetical protein
MAPCAAMWSMASQALKNVMTATRTTMMDALRDV